MGEADGQRDRHGSRRDEPETTIVDQRQTRRAVAAAAIGNTMEWFDFGVYSYIALINHQPGFLPAYQRDRAIAVHLRHVRGGVPGPAAGRVLLLGGLLIIGLTLICFSATMPSTLPALFPTEIRYGAVSVGFNISVALFGGTTPLIAEALVAVTGVKSVPAVLLVAAGAVGLVAVYFTREPAGRSLPGSRPTAADSAQARRRVRDERGEDQD